MNYPNFKTTFFEYGIVTTEKIFEIAKDFDRSNLSIWERKGLLIKLRNEFYSFPEYLEVPGFRLYLANRIFFPSYISLHSALYYHGMIHYEEEKTITSIVTSKRAYFANPFGVYSFQKVKEAVFFGFEKIPEFEKLGIMMATPEKALLDILYLYPHYNTVQAVRELELDPDFMKTKFNVDRFRDYLIQVNNKTLILRGEVLLSAFGI
ncbi:MAG: hypothetical protein PHI48_07625 [Bacteroidales bacterium]|nr:hypothetical protein [Bacteroidales bacterium]MDD4822414.1 hypothetical protein [Bacteroidales bacterium]